MKIKKMFKILKNLKFIKLQKFENVQELENFQKPLYLKNLKLCLKDLVFRRVWLFLHIKSLHLLLERCHQMHLNSIFVN